MLKVNIYKLQASKGVPQRSATIRSSFHTSTDFCHQVWEGKVFWKKIMALHLISPFKKTEFPKLFT